VDVNIGDIANDKGPWGALLFIVWVIGNRMIAAIDRLGTRTEQRIDRLETKVEEHTTKDLAHHSEVREQLAEVRTMVQQATDRRWDELTPSPVEPPPAPRAIPREATTYHKVPKRTGGV
jgi:hypothetical protein